MKKTIAAILLAVCMLLSMTGCELDLMDALTDFAKGISAKLEESENSSISRKETVHEIPKEDRTGRSISVPAQLDRIVCLLPGTTEMLVDLGFGAKLVGLDAQSSDVDGVPANLPQFNGDNPDIAALLELRPDVVFCGSVTGAAVGGETAEESSEASGEEQSGDSQTPASSGGYQQLIDAGICVVCIPPAQSIHDIMEDLLFVAACTQTDAAAEAMVKDMIATLASIQEKAAEVSVVRAVYIEEQPLYAVGNSGLVNEMVRMVGAENIFDNHLGSFWTTADEVAEQNPDYILTLAGEDAAAEVLGREGLQEVAAVVGKHVYALDPVRATRPSHHILDVLQEVAAFLYPSVYGK